MSTHINAQEGMIAEKVLLPGDPLRAKYIAETFLEDVVCYNEVRGMLGFTGTYKGKRVSIQGTGMGMPSISIYVNELLQFYGIKKLIRVGTCGSFQPDLKLRDVVIASGAATNSNMNNLRFGAMTYVPTADFKLLKDAYDAANEQGIKATVGDIFTSDMFYNDSAAEVAKTLTDYGILAVDMETAELYTLAAKFNADALTLLTVSDSIVTGEETTAKERQTSFNEMVKVALEII
ncbi:MAG: purine-nucleoside phosphorylase [Vallitalea sp.]|nr:purine-nucleoside phosphorylase [Vallitalea sp.]